MNTVLLYFIVQLMVFLSWTHFSHPRTYNKKSFLEIFFTFLFWLSNWNQSAHVERPQADVYYSIGITVIQSVTWIILTFWTIFFFRKCRGQHWWGCTFTQSRIRRKLTVFRPYEALWWSETKKQGKNRKYQVNIFSDVLYYHY